MNVLPSATIEGTASRCCGSGGSFSTSVETAVGRDPASARFQGVAPIASTRRRPRLPDSLGAPTGA